MCAGNQTLQLFFKLNVVLYTCLAHNQFFQRAKEICVGDIVVALLPHLYAYVILYLNICIYIYGIIRIIIYIFGIGCEEQKVKPTISARWHPVGCSLRIFGMLWTGVPDHINSMAVVSLDVTGKCNTWKVNTCLSATWVHLGIACVFLGVLMCFDEWLVVWSHFPFFVTQRGWRTKDVNKT